VDPGENLEETAARELFEETGLTPTGPWWLVTAVPLQGYGMDLLSLRYAGPCDAGDVRLSHEHSSWQWCDPTEYRTTHLSGAEVEAWRRSSEAHAFNVRSNRNGHDAFLHWRTR
jgi:8-oxo-dGTP pyrophosphatase MutT (NUDIX family)